MNTVHFWITTVLLMISFQVFSQISPLNIDQFQLEIDGLTVVFDGGEGPYDVEWMGPAGLLSSDESLKVWIPGKYCVRVSDRQCRKCDTCIIVPDISVGQSIKWDSLIEPKLIGPAETGCVQKELLKATSELQLDYNFELKPNPSIGQSILDVFAPVNSELYVDIVDMQGRHKGRIRHIAPSGYSTLLLDNLFIPEGEYLLVVRGVDEKYINHLKWIIAR